MRKNNNNELNTAESKEIMYEKPHEKAKKIKADVTYPSTTKALLLILIGIALLANTLGVLSWGIWLALIIFSPVLFVFWCLKVIFKNARTFVTVLNFFLIFLFGFSLIFFLAIEINQDEKITKYFVISSEKYDDIKTRDVEIHYDVGEFNLKDNDTDDIISVEAQYFKDTNKPELIESFNKDIATLKFNYEDGSLVDFAKLFILNKNVSDARKSNIELGNPGLPISLLINSNFSNGDFSLNDLEILNAKLIVSMADLKGSFDDKAIPQIIEIDAEFGNVDLTLPRDANVKIKYDIAFGNLIVGDKEIEGMSDGNYEVINNDSDEFIMIKAEVSFGSVNINLE